MWKENLYQPFEILVTERTVFLSGIHQHSFFEQGYVLSGTGCLTAFGKKVDYRPGTLFLIPPETTHCYDVSSVSRFVFCVSLGKPSRIVSVVSSSRFSPCPACRNRWRWCLTT